MRFRLLALLLILPLGAALAQKPTATRSARAPKPERADTTLAWKSFGPALDAAAQQQKKVLVFVYTDWCTWCRKIQNEVFADPAIQKYVADHYVSVRLNAESEAKEDFQGKQYEQRELAGAMGANSFPLTVFLSQKSEFITKLPGFVPKDQYLIVLKFIAEEAYLKGSFDDYLKQQGPTPSGGSN